MPDHDKYMQYYIKNDSINSVRKYLLTWHVHMTESILSRHHLRRRWRRLNLLLYIVHVLHGMHYLLWGGNGQIYEETGKRGSFFNLKSHSTLNGFLSFFSPFFFSVFHFITSSFFQIII